MRAIIKRELKSYFTSPAGYVVLAVLTAAVCYFFTTLFSSGYADSSYVFSYISIFILIMIPILTMRLFSEEKMKKTDQLLLTSPVSISSVVLGKFFAALIFFSLFLVETLIFNFIYIGFGASVDWMVYLGNIIGIILFAASFIAIGILISALTESQVVAAILSIAINVIILLFDSIIPSMIDNTVINKICSWVAFNERYQTFTQGIIGIDNLIFFISVIAVFLFLTVRVIDRKRWA